MGFENAAEDGLKTLMLKQVKHLLDKQLRGTVPDDLIKNGLKEFEDILDGLTLFK